MGTPNFTAERPVVARITQNSYVSLGLVGALLAGAMVYGKQSQRLDSLETEVRELRQELRQSRSELQEIRALLVRQSSAR